MKRRHESGQYELPNGRGLGGKRARLDLNRPHVGAMGPGHDPLRQEDENEQEEDGEAKEGISQNYLRLPAWELVGEVGPHGVSGWSPSGPPASELLTALPGCERNAPSLEGDHRGGGGASRRALPCDGLGQRGRPAGEVRVRSQREMLVARRSRCGNAFPGGGYVDVTRAGHAIFGESTAFARRGGNCPRARAEDAMHGMDSPHGERKAPGGGAGLTRGGKETRRHATHGRDAGFYANVAHGAIGRHWQDITYGGDWAHVGDVTRGEGGTYGQSVTGGGQPGAGGLSHGGGGGGYGADTQHGGHAGDVTRTEGGGYGGVGQPEGHRGDGSDGGVTYGDEGASEELGGQGGGGAEVEWCGQGCDVISSHSAQFPGAQFSQPPSDHRDMERDARLHHPQQQLHCTEPTVPSCDPPVHFNSHHTNSHDQHYYFDHNSYNFCHHHEQQKQQEERSGRPEWLGEESSGGSARVGGAGGGAGGSLRDTALGLVVPRMERFGFCILDGFLGEESGGRVLAEVQALRAGGALRAGQLVSPRSDSAVVRGDQTAWVDGSEASFPAIGRLLRAMDELVATCGQRLGGYAITCRTRGMVACYPGGGTGYVRHVDNPARDGRCVTCIYYVNRRWEAELGGVLRIFPGGGMEGRPADVEPHFDRLLLFWSDRRTPHAVLPTYGTRFAITVWYFDAEERMRAKLRYRLAAARGETEAPV